MDQLLLPYKPYSMDMKGTYFAIFGSCEPKGEKSMQKKKYTFKEYY